LALLREQKEKLYAEYSDRVSRASVMIWASYQKLTVADSTALRRQLRAVGAEVEVTKNSLLRLVLAEKGLPTSDMLLKGTSLVVFVYDDIAPAAKALVDFSITKADFVQIKGGLVGGRVATADQVKALISLPSREVLLGQVVGGIQAPISGFVNVLAGVIRGVMNVLNARSDQLKGEGAAS
jgi:large subunit ribosomal protein L10